MKRFIRYLYEYEQGRRLRNVGFVKVEQGDDECTLHIHGKGLHMKGEQKLTLYLFYEDGDGCVGIWQGVVDNVNPAINYRLYYTTEDVGSPENFEKINGIILVSELGHKYAAVWNDMMVDVGRMRLLGPTEVSDEPVEEEAGQMTQEENLNAGIEESNRHMTESGEEQRTENVNTESIEEVPATEVRIDADGIENTIQAPEMGENAYSGTEGAENNISQQEKETLPAQEPAEQRSIEQEPAEQEMAGQESEETQPVNETPRSENICQCTKIQRNDLARLPRCEWKWANNSFLLHGYYNYHHLTLIDDGGRFMLGVPGVYHPQEAKAASVFGFTEFIPVQELEVDLTDDEGCTQEQFGYWCRPVKRPLKM